MANKNSAFDISDQFNITDNLSGYAKALTAIDRELGAKLTDYLPQLIKEQELDAPSIWNSLYEVTAPAEVASVKVDISGKNAK